MMLNKLFKERRSEPRYKIFKRGSIFVNKITIPCFIKDISKNGIRISTDQETDINEFVSFYFIDNGEEIRGRAEVVYVAEDFGSFVYGCRLLSVDPPNYVYRYKTLEERTANGSAD